MHCMYDFSIFQLYSIVVITTHQQCCTCCNQSPRGYNCCCSLWAVVYVIDDSLHPRKNLDLDTPSTYYHSMGVISFSPYGEGVGKGLVASQEDQSLLTELVAPPSNRYLVGTSSQYPSVPKPSEFQWSAETSACLGVDTAGTSSKLAFTRFGVPVLGEVWDNEYLLGNNTFRL